MKYYSFQPASYLPSLCVIGYAMTIRNYRVSDLHVFYICRKQMNHEWKKQQAKTLLVHQTGRLGI